MDRNNDETCKLLLEHAADCIWLFDLADMRFKFISPSIMNLRGLTVEDTMKEKVEDSFTPESFRKIKRLCLKRLKKFLKGDRSQEVVAGIDEFQQICKDGTIKNVEISTKFIMNGKTNFVDVIGVSRDITERKESEAAINDQIEELMELNRILWNIANTDGLTSLYNRYLFNRKIMEEVDRADRDHHPLSLIIFDLDHFKRINDTCGHDAGDRVLIETAELVGKLIRKADTLARWGGEEFAILMPYTALEGAVQAAEKLRAALAENLHSDAGQVTASFGVAERLAGESWKKWFNRADQALYQAKNQGRNCVVCCDHTAVSPIAVVRLEWRTEWESGHKTIDDQHRELLELANGLIDLSISDVKSDQVIQQLHRLLEHVDVHFADEKNILKEAGFPEAEQHAEKHKSLINKAHQLKDRYLIGELRASDVFSYVFDEVIIGHLQAEDALFFPYIQKNNELPIY